MPVAVYQPQREKERDPLDTIAKGLSIATSIYGISAEKQKLAVQQAKEAREANYQAQQLERQAGVDARQEQRLNQDQEIKGAGMRDKGYVEITDALGNKSYEMPRNLNGARGAAVLTAPTVINEQGFEVGGFSSLPRMKSSDQKKTEADLKHTEAQTRKIEADKGKDSTKAAWDETGKLRTERSSSPVTKDTQSIAVAYDKVRRSAEGKSPSSDMSMIFGIMKMFDPSSTVREGEYASAKNAGAIPDRVLDVYNKLRGGTLLTPEQRADFLNTADQMYQAQIGQQRQVDSFYSNLAKERGLDPSQVIVPFEVQERQKSGLALQTPKSQGSFFDFLGSHRAQAQPSQEVQSKDPILESLEQEKARRLMKQSGLKGAKLPR